MSCPDIKGAFEVVIRREEIQRLKSEGHPRLLASLNVSLFLLSPSPFPLSLPLVSCVDFHASLSHTFSLFSPYLALTSLTHFYPFSFPFSLPEPLKLYSLSLLPCSPLISLSLHTLLLPPPSFLIPSSPHSFSYPSPLPFASQFRPCPFSSPLTLF